MSLANVGPLATDTSVLVLQWYAMDVIVPCTFVYLGNLLLLYKRYYKYTYSNLILNLMSIRTLYQFNNLFHMDMTVTLVLQHTIMHKPQMHLCTVL